MQLKVNYELSKQGWASTLYGITIECDGNFSPFFYKQLISEDNKWIVAENLLSEKYLSDNNIEFIIDEDTKEIIPLGLIEFCNDYGNRELRLLTNQTESLYKVNQVIKNVIKAIKLKYEAFELAEKCMNKVVENIVV